MFIKLKKIAVEWPFSKKTNVDKINNKSILNFEFYKLKITKTIITKQRKKAILKAPTKIVNNRDQTHNQIQTIEI